MPGSVAQTSTGSAAEGWSVVTPDAVSAFSSSSLITIRTFSDSTMIGFDSAPRLFVCAAEGKNARALTPHTTPTKDRQMYTHAAYLDAKRATSSFSGMISPYQPRASPR